MTLTLILPERAATGSAHAALAPYWAEILGKRELTGYQVSQRGGWIRVCVVDDERVEVRGQAVTVIGSLHSAPGTAGTRL